MIDADGNPVEAIGLFTAEHLLPSGVAEISGLVFGVLIFFTIISATLVVSRLFVAFAERRGLQLLCPSHEGAPPCPRGGQCDLVQRIFDRARSRTTDSAGRHHVHPFTPELGGRRGATLALSRPTSPFPHATVSRTAIAFALLYLWLGIFCDSGTRAAPVHHWWLDRRGVVGTARRRP